MKLIKEVLKIYIEKKTHIFWNFTAISVLNKFKPDNRPAIDTVFTLKCFFNVTTNNKKETINLYWCTCCTEHRKKDKIICIIYTIKDYNPVIIIGFTNLIFFFRFSFDVPAMWYARDHEERSFKSINREEKNCYVQSTSCLYWLDVTRAPRQQLYFFDSELFCTSKG